jgi:hypothetical protein
MSDGCPELFIGLGYCQIICWAGTAWLHGRKEERVKNGNSFFTRPLTADNHF